MEVFLVHLLLLVFREGILWICRLLIRIYLIFSLQKLVFLFLSEPRAFYPRKRLDLSEGISFDLLIKMGKI